MSPSPNCNWLVVSTPLKNISQLGWLFPIYGKIKNVPNHQPAINNTRTTRTPRTVTPSKAQASKLSRSSREVTALTALTTRTCSETPLSPKMTSYDQPRTRQFAVESYWIMLPFGNQTWLESGPFIGDVPTRTSIQRGFPIAMLITRC